MEAWANAQTSRIGIVEIDVTDVGPMLLIEIRDIGDAQIAAPSSPLDDPGDE